MYQWRGSWMSRGALHLAASKAQGKSSKPSQQADVVFGGLCEVVVHVSVLCSRPPGKGMAVEDAQVQAKHGPFTNATFLESSVSRELHVSWDLWAMHP